MPTSFSTVFPSGFSTPKSLLSCPTVTKHGEAHDEAGHHRLGQELGDEAEAGDAGNEEHEAGDEHEGRRVGRVGLRIGLGREGRGDEGRGDDEASSAAVAEVPPTLR